MADQEEELDGEPEEQDMNIPEIWRYAEPAEGGAMVGKIVKYLNGKEEEELLEEVRKPNPGTGQSFLMWAVLQQKFVLVEWLIKKMQRGGFAFGEKEVGVYEKFVEKRKEREQEEKERLEALEENGEEPEEEPEPLPPIHELVVADYADDETLDQYKIRAVGELGIYEGQRNPIDNTKSGLGQALYPNGDCYIGEYKDNKRYGVGCYWWSGSGEIYIGSWTENHRDGSGRMLHPDGGKYYGSWTMDEKSGKGRYTYPTGDTYAGDWENGVRQGQGTFTVASDSSTFIGVFDKGVFTTGEWRLAGGTRYYGAFEDFRPCGKGVFLHKYGQEGAFTQDGCYENGEWCPVNVRKAGATGGVSFATEIQGRYVVMRPKEEAKMTLMTLVRVANFAPFDRWVKGLKNTPGGSQAVTSVVVDLVVWQPTAKLISSASLTITATTPTGTIQYPVVLIEDLTIFAPVVTCTGKPPVVVHLQSPRPSSGTLSAPALIELPVQNKFDAPHLVALRKIGMDIAQNTTVSVNKIVENPLGYHLQAETVTAVCDVLFFTQEVTEAYYAALPGKLSKLLPEGGFTAFVCSELDVLAEATPSLASYGTLQLLKSLGEDGKLPKMTVSAMRPPTPPPPVAEERPELTEAIPEEVLEAPKEEDEEDE